MKIKVKKLVSHAIIPEYANPGDAGMDLYATDYGESEDGLYLEYGTGLAFEIPKGYVGLIFPRSSISKTPLSLANSVGIIDSGYRGEISFRFKRIIEDREHLEYQAGDRIGQLMVIPIPRLELEETTNDLSETVRGIGGYGSSGT